MEQKIIGFYKDIGQFIVGKVVDETDSTIVIRQGVLLVIRGSGVSAKPIELINEEPDVSIRHVGLMKNPDQHIDFSFNKSDIKAYVELSDNIVAEYVKMTSQVAQAAAATAPKSPEDNVIKLFD
jgi:hypothetical protein